MRDDSRVARLEELLAALSARDPWPDHLDVHQQEAWMDRVGADGGLAGLLSSAIHGQRYWPAELAEHRAASERYVSRLDPATVVDAYELLARR